MGGASWLPALRGLPRRFVATATDGVNPGTSWVEPAETAGLRTPSGVGRGGVQPCRRPELAHTFSEAD